MGICHKALVRAGFLFVIINLIFCFCQKQESQDEKPIARVNDGAISVAEFRLFYELDPNFGIDSAGVGAVFDELHKMVDHKVSYRLAQQEGLAQDSSYMRALQWEKSRAMLRELYRDQVEGKITITENELRSEFFKNRIQVHVRHLFSTDSSQLAGWQKQIRQGRAFEAIAAQTFSDTILAKNGGDLGWITLDKLDQDFAEAVRHLEKNAISPPVKTRWGYHLIQLLDRNDDVIMSEDEYLKNRQAITKKIKAAKSAVLSRKYISDYIGRLNPQPVPKTFASLWETIAGQNTEKKVLLSPILFNNQQLGDISGQLQARLEEPLIRYKGGEVTLGQYLIALKSIPQSNRPRVQQVHDLSNRMAVWIRDELLLEEAYRKKLDRSQKVRTDVREFAEDQAYLYYLQQEYSRIKVPADIVEYFENKKAVRRRELQKFHTLEEWKSREAERNLHDYLRKIPVDIRIDTARIKQEAAEINWNNRIRMFVIPKPE